MIMIVIMIMTMIKIRIIIINIVPGWVQFTSRLDRTLSSQVTTGSPPRHLHHLNPSATTSLHSSVRQSLSRAVKMSPRKWRKMCASMCLCRNLDRNVAMFPGIYK